MRVTWKEIFTIWYHTSFAYIDVTAGSFEIRIYSLNATGVPSAVPLSNTTIATGKDRSPSTVTNFSYTLDPKLGFILHWDKLVAVYPYFDDLDVVGDTQVSGFLRVGNPAIPQIVSNTGIQLFTMGGAAYYSGFTQYGCGTIWC